MVLEIFMIGFLMIIKLIGSLTNFAPKSPKGDFAAANNAVTASFRNGRAKIVNEPIYLSSRVILNKFKILNNYLKRISAFNSI